MAEARITVSFTPAEFDLARSELEKRLRQHEAIVGARGSVAPDRTEARKQVVLLTDLLKKLR